LIIDLAIYHIHRIFFKDQGQGNQAATSKRDNSSHSGFGTGIDTLQQSLDTLAVAKQANPNSDSNSDLAGKRADIVKAANKQLPDLEVKVNKKSASASAAAARAKVKNARS
jgi:hypothetical protein